MHSHFLGHVDTSGEGIYGPIGDPSGGIVRKWFQSFVIEPCAESWVSIEIYYHDNFVFGHICMFDLNYAHFCVLCAQLVG